MPVAPDAPNAVAQVSCGRVARSQWAVIVDPDTGRRTARRQRRRDLVARRQHRPRILGAAGRDRAGRSATSCSRGSVRAATPTAPPTDATWLRTGDLGVYLDGELYITGRIKDMVIVDGRNHYPQDIEATVAEASTPIRAGFVAAFAVPARELPDGRRRTPARQLVIVAERAAGRGPGRPAARRRRHPRGGVAPARPVTSPTCGWSPPDAIPRTTSGKLARRACRAAIPRWPIRPVLAKPHHGQACMPQVFAKTLLLQRELDDVDLAVAEQLRAAGEVLHVAVVDLLGLDRDGLVLVRPQAAAHRSSVLA